MNFLNHSFIHNLFISDDELDNEVVWEDYWRILFPKITTQDIDSFVAKYVGSDEEKVDVREAYLRFKGNMNKIYECVIGFDEERTSKLIESMIEAGEIPTFAAFANESTDKKEKRRKKIEKEAKLAEKEKKKMKGDENCDDLVKAIQLKSKANFDGLIAQLEAKYGKPSRTVKSKKKK